MISGRSRPPTRIGTEILPLAGFSACRNSLETIALRVALRWMASSSMSIE